MKEMMIILEEAPDCSLRIAEKPSCIMDDAEYRYLKDYFKCSRLGDVRITVSSLIQLLNDGFIIRKV